MTSTLMALALGYVGAAALALAMDRHQRQVGGRHAKHALGWRLLGGTAWGASLLLCGLSSGWAVGVVQWLGVLTVACLLVMVVLTFWPRRLLGGWKPTSLLIAASSQFTRSREQAQTSRLQSKHESPRRHE